MRVERERGRPINRATTRTWGAAGATRRTLPPRSSSRSGRRSTGGTGSFTRRRQGVSRLTLGACTICTATCGSGARTGTRTCMGEVRRLIRQVRGMGRLACCAAGRGTTTRGTAAPRAASGTRPETVTTITVFGVCGPSLPRDPLPPYPVTAAVGGASRERTAQFSDPLPAWPHRDVEFTTETRRTQRRSATQATERTEGNC
jgi:hypothetical protein